VINVRFSKRIMGLFLAVCLVAGLPFTAFAGGIGDELAAADTPAEETTADAGLEFTAKSALLMDYTTGTILFEKNSREVMPPASITKIMTLILVMEALDAGKFQLTDMVTCSEYASGMGGSEIWLEAGEQMSVNDLLKAVAISSANDAAVALAELVAGSIEAFVTMMNDKAKALGMNDTSFKNASGLDAEGHLTTAYDIALMSRELMKHEKIFEYTTIWMDTLRDGKTGLVNTNKLIRFYEGATGLKTGTTDEAGSCISATAKKGDMHLIAVIMGCENSTIRNSEAKKLLEYGFKNFTLYVPELDSLTITPVKVLHGIEPEIMPIVDKADAIIIKRGTEGSITQQVTICEDVAAPVEEGQVLGKIVLLINGEEIGSYSLKAEKAVPKMTMGRAFGILFKTLIDMKM